MWGLLALPIVLGAGAIAIATDMGGSIATLFRGRSVEEMGELYEKQRVLSELITLAVLADGEVTPTEEATLRELFRDEDKFTGDVDEAIAHLKECARRASKQESFENTVRILGSDLDDEWREDAFRFVAMLTLRGAGFGSHEQGFRVAPMSDPGSLLAIFARGLDIPEDVREAAIRNAGA